MEFKPGDVVRLKSGGPAMTVESVGDHYMTGETGVTCVWFEKVGNKSNNKRERFSPVVLEHFKPGIGAISVRR
ncbi:YodC family protein [Pararhodospirillum oryzae]|uniref:DUF2158 domain-containing protein n=1 Tax=Pararhodospirillum oryzae TaxID=478448 RepID=A0A512H678_9PROT|nr:DUF2158 domain-containing protein [Pararhodospirillum oryzae]GEO80969.1 hypothetical protein ROR02_11000 [Pararhodospirillum oryzae]